MISDRQLFLRHLAQTSDHPMMLEIERAAGIYLFDIQGNKYIDLISGINVSNVGHLHQKVVLAIEEQLKHYMHLMVYGEFIQSPQVSYARLLTEHLPEKLSSVYFTNSGTEATEGAMKLAKRVTGRTEFISFFKSYHGHTQGALSVMGDEYWKQAYRPLLPDTRLLPFNDFKAIELITEDTAAVIIEPIQAEAGVILPQAGYLSKIRGRCDDMGVLLIFDEIQTGMGRTGTLFFFEQQGVVPDILLLAKSFGGGLPLGAFISSHQNMTALTHDPVLGHLTTFGGNALCCASGKAAMEVLLKYDLMAEIKGKQEIFNHWLKHKRIKQFRVAGLLMALEFYDERFNKEVIKKCIENGLIVDWFLFAPECMRIAPPLTITQEEINIACKILLRSIETVSNQG